MIHCLGDENVGVQDVYQLPNWTASLKSKRRVVAEKTFKRGYLHPRQLQSQAVLEIFIVRPYLEWTNTRLESSRMLYYSHTTELQKGWRELFYHYFYPEVVTE